MCSNSNTGPGSSSLSAADWTLHLELLHHGASHHSTTACFCRWCGTTYTMHCTGLTLPGCTAGITTITSYAVAQCIPQGGAMVVTVLSSNMLALLLTALQAMDKLMPGFDGEIARMAQRLLINPRPIDYHTGVIATKVTPGVPGKISSSSSSTVGMSAHQQQCGLQCSVRSCAYGAWKTRYSFGTQAEALLSLCERTTTVKTCHTSSAMSLGCVLSYSDNSNLLTSL